MKTKYLIAIIILFASLAGNSQNEIIEAEFYLDQDPGFGSATPIDLTSGETISEVFSAELGDFEPGVYFAYVRVKDENDSWSIPLKKAFLINDKFPLDVVAAEYFIDEDPGIGSGLPIDVDADHFVVESYLAEVAPDLEIGDHFLYTRVQNEEGDWSINVVRTFSVGTVSTEDEALLSTTSVYPIPARDFLVVQNNQFSILEVRLFDANGRIVKARSWQGRRMELSDLSAGTYLLRITTEAGSLTRRIVVE